MNVTILLYTRCFRPKRHRCDSVGVLLVAAAVKLAWGDCWGVGKRSPCTTTEAHGLLSHCCCACTAAVATTTTTTTTTSATTLPPDRRTSEQYNTLSAGIAAAAAAHTRTGIRPPGFWVINATLPRRALVGRPPTNELATVESWPFFKSVVDYKT